METEPSRDREQARPSLPSQERLLQLIADALPAFVSYVGTDERYVFVNRRYESWFGRPLREIVGKTMREVLGEAGYERARPNIRRVLAGESLEYENSLKDAQGRTRWFRGQYHPDRDERGNVRGMVVLGSDITDLKIIEIDHRFRAELSQRIAASGNDVAGLIGLSTRALAEHLDASRCWISEIDPSANTATVRPGFARGLEPLTGTFPLESFGPEMVASWKAGQVVQVDDVRDDSRTREHHQAHESLGIRSFVTVPMLRQGQMVAALNVSSHEPRRWTSREMELSRSVVETLWAAIENARLFTALSRSEAGFRQLSEAIPQIVWSSRPEDGTITYVNGRWYEYTGIPRGKLDNEAWKSAIHPEDWIPLQKAWSESWSKGSDLEFEYRIRGKDGVYRWFLCRSVALRDEGGDILRWFGTGTEIDEQRRLLDSMRFLDEVNVLLASSLDISETLTSIANLAVPRLADWCSIELANEQGVLENVAVAHRDPAKVEFAREIRRRYPIDMEQVTGAPKVFRTGAPELLREIPDSLLALIARDEEHLRLGRELGLRSALIVPLSTKGKTYGALSLIYAESERRYDEPDLKLAQALAVRAALAIENARLYSDVRAKETALLEAVRARDEFLSIASHELKTPLTSLKLKTEVSRRRFESDPASFADPQVVGKLLDSTARQVDRLGRLVEDMLDISRIAHGKLQLDPEEVDLAHLVRDVLDRFEEPIRLSGSRVRVTLDSSVRGIWDRHRIEQVVINLLTNALKYGDRKPIEISATLEGETARLMVRDQGIGIEPDSLSRIFDRFERAISASNISGLGLGLYISRQIVAAHEGRIWAESVPGQGSVFYVELPLRRA